MSSQNRSTFTTNMDTIEEVEEEGMVEEKKGKKKKNVLRRVFRRIFKKKKNKSDTTMDQDNSKEKETKKDKKEKKKDKKNKKEKEEKKEQNEDKKDKKNKKEKETKKDKKLKKKDKKNEEEQSEFEFGPSCSEPVQQSDDNDGDEKHVTSGQLAETALEKDSSEMSTDSSEEQDKAWQIVERTFYIRHMYSKFASAKSESDLKDAQLEPIPLFTGCFTLEYDQTLPSDRHQKKLPDFIAKASISSNIGEHWAIFGRPRLYSRTRSSSVATDTTIGKKRKAVYTSESNLEDVQVDDTPVTTDSSTLSSTQTSSPDREQEALSGKASISDEEGEKLPDFTGHTDLNRSDIGFRSSCPVATVTTIASASNHIDTRKEHIPLFTGYFTLEYNQRRSANRHQNKWADFIRKGSVINFKGATWALISRPRSDPRFRSSYPVVMDTTISDTRTTAYTSESNLEDVQQADFTRKASISTNESKELTDFSCQTYLNSSDSGPSSSSVGTSTSDLKLTVSDYRFPKASTSKNAGQMFRDVHCDVCNMVYRRFDRSDDAKHDRYHRDILYLSKLPEEKKEKKKKNVLRRVFKKKKKKPKKDEENRKVSEFRFIGTSTSKDGQIFREVECEVCAMAYRLTDPSDEAKHAKYHRDILHLLKFDEEDFEEKPEKKKKNVLKRMFKKKQKKDSETKTVEENSKGKGKGKRQK